MRLLVFDTETSSPIPEEAFLVTAFLGLMDGEGKLLKEWNWVIDQGQPVPDEAAAIHGYTTQRVQAEGRKDVDAALLEILDVISENSGPGSQVPLVSHNSRFDLSLISREWARHGLPVLPFDEYPILDTMTCDRALDKWRKGSRRLEDVAVHYGIELGKEGSAHSADYDAILAGKIALKLRPKLRAMHKGGDFWEWMMDYQGNAYRESALSFASYKRGEQKRKPDEIEPDFVAQLDWPVSPIVVA